MNFFLIILNVYFEYIKTINTYKLLVFTKNIHENALFSAVTLVFPLKKKELFIRVLNTL